MKNELNELDGKILQITTLVQHLRQENNDLRQQLVAAQSENLRLIEKVDGAKARVESLLQSFPEDNA